MSYGSNITANRFKQSYFKGFIDISGDGLRLRNDMSINFFDTTNSLVPKFSIKSDSMRITDTVGVQRDISNTQLLYISDLSTSAQTQINTLTTRTKNISTDVSNANTMLLLNDSTNVITLFSNIVPYLPNTVDLGTPAFPFNSLYVNEGTIHFINPKQKNITASLSFNPTTNSLDLSAGGISAPVNNTTIANGVVSSPVLYYGGNVGINTTTPMSALDISGTISVKGASTFTGSVSINDGDLSLNGNLLTSTVYENGLPISNKYASIHSPILTGNATVESLNVTKVIASGGDLLLNGRMFANNDVSMNANLYVGGNVLIPTPPTADNSKLAATTAFVKNQNYAPISNPSLTGTTTMVVANITQKMIVAGDVSLNSKLGVYDTVSLQSTLTVAGATNINNNLTVTGIASFNSGLTVPPISTTDNSNKVASTSYVQNQGYAKLSGANFTGDVSLNGNLLVNGKTIFVGDVSTNGSLYAQTQANSDISNKVATTAFVKNQGYATLVSPSFTGNVILPIATVSNQLLVFGNATFYGNNNVALTQATNDNSTKLATTAFVKNQAYAPLSSPTFTGSAILPTTNVSKNLSVSGDTTLSGNLSVAGTVSFLGPITAPNASYNDNSTTIATTSFVQSQGYAQLSGADFTGPISTGSNLSVTGTTTLNGFSEINGDVSLNGNVTGTTQLNTDNSTYLATTAYVQNQGYATLASPALVGYPTAPTASLGSISTQVATTEYVRNEVTSFINSLPSALDAIQKLSNALSNTDASFATTLASSLGSKADLINPTFTGTVTMPIAQITEKLYSYGDVSFNNNLYVGGDIFTTGSMNMTTPPTNDNSTKVATTAFVKNQGYALLSGANFTGDISTTGSSTINNSLTIANKLFLGSDASLNGNVNIKGKLVTKSLTTLSDSSLNGNVTVTGSLSAVTPPTNDNSTFVATTAYVQNQGFANLTGANFTGDISTTGHLFTNGDASFNSNVIIQGLVNINNNTTINGDVSLNQNLHVVGVIQENGQYLINKYATLASPTFTGNVGGITKYMVGLGNLDNTSDINKPISSVTQTALNLKADIYNPTINGNMVITNNLSVLSANITTSNISNLYVSNETTIGGNVSIAGDLSLGGNLYTQTQTPSDNSNRVATTAYVKNQGFAQLSGANFTGPISINNNLSVSNDVSFNNKLFVQSDSNIGGNIHVNGTAQIIGNTILNNTVVNNNLSVNGVSTFNNSVKIVGDLSMVGNLYTQSPTTNDNSNHVATTAYVQNQGFAPLSSPTFTGVPIAPTAITGTSTTQIATTEYVCNQVASFVNALPDTLSAINKLSAALSQTDASFAASFATIIEAKSDLRDPAFLGTVSIPNANISNTLSVNGISNFNNSVYIVGDVSLSGNLTANYKNNSIPSSAIIGLPGLNGAFASDVSVNYRLFVGGDSSLNSNLHVAKNTNVGGVLIVGKDASLNGNLYVNQNATIHNNLSVNSQLNVINDVSFNQYLSVGGDASVGGDLSVDGVIYSNSNIYENGSLLSATYAPQQYPTFSGTATFDKITTSGLLTVGRDTTIAGQLTVSQNINTDKNLHVTESIYEGGTALINKYVTISNPTFSGAVSGIDKSMVGLSNADNTSDMNKPISTAQQSALDLKSDIDSPIFTGIPQAPTATTGTNTSQIATTSFVRGEISNLIGSAPSTLDTLQELATAINSDASFASTVAASIGLKAPVNSPTFTGTAILPTTIVSQKLTAIQDISINGNLIIGKKLQTNGDASLNGNVSVNGFFTANYPNSSIPSSAIDNIANQYGKFMFQTQRNDIVTFDDEFFETSISAGVLPVLETLYVNNSDLSLNGNLYIHGSGTFVLDADVSFNKGLYVHNDIYENGLALSAKYAPLSGPLFSSNVTLPNLVLTSDASFNGNLYVAQTVYENGASLASTYAKLNTPTFTGTVTLKNDASFNGNLRIAQTIYENGASLVSTYSKINTPTFTGTVTVPYLVSTSDVSMNTNLKIGGNLSLNNILDITGSIVAHDNINLSGIINQYTLSLEDGYKVSYDTASQISTLQNQVANLQSQLANVLQILANNNIH